MLSSQPARANEQFYCHALLGKMHWPGLPCQPQSWLKIIFKRYQLALPLLQDVITDLNAEGEPLPIRPINEDWIGHKVRNSSE